LKATGQDPGSVEKGEKNGQKIAVLLMVMDRKLPEKKFALLD
jgi:hypothetical protein